MNLFRDQLDRYGELEHLVDRWHDAVAQLDPATIVVYNADDPAVAEIAAQHPTTISYGIEDPRVGRDRLPHAADTTECRRCGARLHYDMVTIAHLGRWSCSECDLARPLPDVGATKVELHGMDGQRLGLATPHGPMELSLRLPGLHNAYNAAAATATALALGLAPPAIGPALACRQAAFGRAERTQVGPTRVTTLLAKNPAGANENIHTMLLEDHPLHLLVLLNDRTADGQDVSWIWDVDYELLLGGNRLASLTVGGDRAYDLALRFRYAGLDARPPVGGAPRWPQPSTLPWRPAAPTATSTCCPPTPPCSSSKPCWPTGSWPPRSGRTSERHHSPRPAVPSVPGPPQHLRRPGQHRGVPEAAGVARAGFGDS